VAPEEKGDGWREGNGTERAGMTTVLGGETLREAGGEGKRGSEVSGPGEVVMTRRDGAGGGDGGDWRRRRQSELGEEAVRGALAGVAAMALELDDSPITKTERPSGVSKWRRNGMGRTGAAVVGARGKVEGNGAAGRVAGAGAWGGGAGRQLRQQGRARASHGAGVGAVAGPEAAAAANGVTAILRKVIRG
jgi:hypothetical protein